MKGMQDVLTQDKHNANPDAYCLIMHNCYMEQIKDVLDLMKLNCPTRSTCDRDLCS